VAGTVAGGVLLPPPGGRWAAIALGAALAAYAAIGLASVRLAVPPRLEAGLSPSMGILTGLVTAATGVFVIPAVPYLQALGLGKEDLVQALGLAFTTSTIALGASLVLRGSFATGSGGMAGMAGMSVCLLAPALAGMLAGQRIRQRLRPALFRTLFFGGLLVLGLYQCSRAVA